MNGTRDLDLGGRAAGLPGKIKADAQEGSGNGCILCNRERRIQHILPNKRAMALQISGA